MLVLLLQVITDKIREDDESGHVENDWKFAAMVIDRVCLIGTEMMNQYLPSLTNPIPLSL